MFETCAEAQAPLDQLGSPLIFKRGVLSVRTGVGVEVRLGRRVELAEKRRSFQVALVRSWRHCAGVGEGERPVMW